ncbi:MAG: prolyl oligopeptidase family serine peptidase [Candidatus Cloacimonetes bacterium]|nr:prolyl oligopeptidase family serine peptidase [Candidatus Cloacimonadota bacterium]
MRKELLPCLLIVMMLSMIFQPAFAQKRPPLAPVKPDTLHFEGRQLVDDWAWLKDRENPLLPAVLKAEKRYADDAFKPTRKLAGKLYKEFVATIPSSESSHPRLDNGYYYYSKSFKGKAYDVNYRRKAVAKAKEEVVLDSNKLAAKKPYFALGCYAISPNQGILAYSVDYRGDELYTLYLKDLAGGKTRQTALENISDFVWQNDNRHAIITLVNERLQTDKCYRLDTQTMQLTQLFSEVDPAYDLSLYRNCDKSYIFLLCYSKNATEVHYLPSENTEANWQIVTPRKPDHIYYPDIYRGSLYNQTNLWDKDGSIAVCSLDNPDISAWKELIPFISNSPISTFQIFEDNLVIIRRQNGFQQIEICDRRTGAAKQTVSSTDVASLDFWFNPDPHAKGFTYSKDGDLIPYSIYNWDFETAEQSLLYRQNSFVIPAQAGIQDNGFQNKSGMTKKNKFDLNNYKSQVLSIPTENGISIPLTLVYKADLDISKPHPLWLSAYGAYGDCNDPYFSSLRLSLLDRGAIYAVAHIRGGGELGHQWYETGRKLNKKNSFTDFIGCMDYLLDSGITSKDLLIIEGGSAGGLLMGAVANLAGEKCRLVIADVPFVDALFTMLDDTLPLTIQEYEEWGDPHDKEVFSYLLSYSPYNNVSRRVYPEMLITAAWNDTRVGYWEALKWTQKLRSSNTAETKIVFRMMWNEGHTGSGDRYQYFKYYAQTMAYALYQVGIRE